MKSIKKELQRLNESDKPDMLHVSILQKWLDGEPTVDGFRNSGRMYPSSYINNIDPEARVHSKCHSVFIYLFGVFIQQLADGTYLFDHIKGKGSTIHKELKFVEEEAFNNIKSLIKK